ncbi:TIGR02679 family protein [Amycolatopsis cihanbeyliensis]|uniref:Uncharacterized protein (TIGR02679 family) n=1 Tax=Amycolatopsis cihanbeyliensis TaxID=1128664 RepID=A0A542DM77_AMYCI|nr:TIGR02679 family protein [Amycolatopsis cihanbeyliensis]TQJ04202.1 uncharacterized protein (TIGR02679 family) [Amycolatopsis cihanbeyliensis]
MRLPESWRSAALRPLWRSAHHRLSSGRPVSRLRVGPLEPEQRAAVADLLGMDRLPGEHCTITMAKLDEVLHDTVGAGAREVVAELVGPLGDRAGERARGAAERARLWDWLAEHPLVTRQPVLRDWVSQLRRAGLIDGSVPRTRRVLEQALGVLDRLPAGGESLQVLAERATGDAHELDDGTRLAGIVLRALAVQFDLDPPGNADRRRELWERAGVSVDQLSTQVLVAGLRPEGDALACRLARACAAEGEAVALTLAQLRGVDRFAVAEPVVWVVENPSVLSAALRRFGTDCPPLVCTAGWPSSAGVLLLRLLAAAGADLRYHGDLDGDGVRIAAYVLAKTGAQPWRMSAEDYRAALRTRPHGPSPGRVTEAPWDAELAPALREHGVAVVEERVTGLLLDDLAGN